jgi:folate-binding protein YgfZ
MFMTSTENAKLPGYEAALHQTAYLHQAEAGYLRILGKDRRAFLQRQTTNDVEALSPNRSLTTVLTSATARILDVLTLIEGPEAIRAITLPGRAAATAAFLKGKIFFMDQVQIEDASAKLAQYDLLGPQTPHVMAELGFQPVPVKNERVQGEISGTPVQAINRGGWSYRLIFPAAVKQEIEEQIEAAGATKLSPESYAVLRVEMGLPEAGHELIEDYTPLETGLEWAISGSKGCYTGQEVIARQITYDKVTRQLVGVELNEPVKPGERIASLPDGKSIGEITSYARSPRCGHIALAIVRKPYHEPDTEVAVERDNQRIQALIRRLPFDPEKENLAG